MALSKSITKMLGHSALSIACLIASQQAGAVTINPIHSSAGIGTTLTNALLAPGSGINVVGGSINYQGTNTASLGQSGLYSGFNLAPSSGATPTLALADGILLTTGSAAVPSSNTTTAFSTVTGSGTNAQMASLLGSANDANTLGFSFTVGAGVSSVNAKFVFGTDEFSEYSITDIFGFFVDGVNYAHFSNGQLISNAPGGATNFIDNGSGLYGIEYDGLTNVLSVTGLLDSSMSTHTFIVGIADTSDFIVDSGVFLTSLEAGVATGGGIGVPGQVPEPASLVLFGIGALAAAGMRRKQRKIRG